MATCGEALVRLLEAYGVDMVFGIPGVHTVELYRGLPATRRSGVGLTSIRERTTELGGTLRIESTAGEGTHVRVWLPLTKEHQ